MIRAPDPRLLLATSTVLLLLHEPQLFTSRSSYTIFSKSRSIPSATTQKHPNPLSSHLSAHKSTFHFFSQSLDLHSQLTQIATPKPDLSSKGFNWCCWLVVAAQRSGWGEKKIRWCRWRGKKQMGTKKKKEEDGDALCEKKKKKKKGKERKWKRWKWVVWNFLKYKGGLTKIYKITNLPFNINIGYYTSWH